MSYLQLLIKSKQSSLKNIQGSESCTEEGYLALLKVFKEELFNFEVILDYLRQFFKPPSLFEKKPRKRKEVYKESKYHFRRNISKGLGRFKEFFACLDPNIHLKNSATKKKKNLPASQSF
jgi:hypothetical protein